MPEMNEFEFCASFKIFGTSFMNSPYGWSLAHQYCTDLPPILKFIAGGYDDPIIEKSIMQANFKYFTYGE